MYRMSLDKNCLIAVEEGRKYAPAVKQLLAAHRAGTIDLALHGMTASERPKNISDQINFDDFVARAERSGFGGLPILKPLFGFGLTFWGESVWASEEQIKLHKEIFHTLFPETPMELQNFCEKKGRSAEEGGKGWWEWVNKMCDAGCLLAHIEDKRTIFVTNDTDFLDQSDIIKQRWGVISMKPDDAVKLLD